MLNLVEGIYLGEAKEAEGFTGLRTTKKLRIGGGAIPEANNFVTQSGDIIVTSAGTPLALDGISSLTTAPSITDTQLTFADDGNSTVSFSMQQLKDYISPAPAKQGRFVIASANKIVYSDDGLSWTEIDNTSGASIVSFGNGKFVAIKRRSSIEEYSLDGILWENVVLPHSDIYDIASSEDSYVATRLDRYNCLYSEDAINWVSTSIPDQLPLYPLVKYVKDRYIIYNESTPEYSFNGTTWNTYTVSNPYHAGMSDVAYGNDIFVSVSGSRTFTETSTDGINWTCHQSVLPITGTSCEICFGNGKFIVTSGTDNYSNSVAISIDGINWSTATLPSTGYWGNIIYGNGMFIISCYDSNIYAYSQDGINWIQSTLPSSQKWWSIAYGEV